MEDSLQRLNDIMKPYFDKKQEIEDNNNKLSSDKIESQEKIQDLKKERIERRKDLEKELEQLRVRLEVRIKDFENRKNNEINEYIEQASNSSSGFYIGYIDHIRKDLEKDYDKRLQEIKDDFNTQEEQILNEIKSLRSRQEEETSEISNLESLNNKPDYRNVDLRELVEVKWGLRKELYSYKEELTLKLSQEELNFKQAMLKLSNFKYEYDDQKRVINGQEFRILYENSNEISDRIQKLREAIKKVEEYQNLMETTPEENAAVMRSMFPWEKEEYDRRKNLRNNKGINEEKELDDLKDNSSLTETVDEEKNSDLIETIDEVKKPDAVYAENGVVVNTTSDLLSLVFNEIMDEVKDMRSVKINPSKGELGKSQAYISTKDSLDNDYNLSKTTLDLSDEEDLQLPNGEYINSDDFNKALDEYQNKNKGRTFIVSETSKKYSATQRSLRKFKDRLKKCSALKLLRDNKLSKLDILKVFGKGKGETEYRDSHLVTLHGIENMPEGEYISKKELIVSLTSLLSRKKLEWLKNMSKKLKEKLVDRNIDELSEYEKNYDTLDIDENYVIK